MKTRMIMLYGLICLGAPVACSVEETNTSGTGGTGGDGASTSVGGSSASGFAGSSGVGGVGGVSGFGGDFGGDGTGGSSGFSGSSGDAGSSGVGGEAGVGSSEPMQYAGDAVGFSTSWISGKPVHISVKGGSLRDGFASTSIYVSGGGRTEAIAVTFQPFETNVDANQAYNEMQDDLVVNMVDTGSEILVTVDEQGDHDPSLSATVSLTLPEDFAGDIIAWSESGDIYLEGANGSVDVQTTSGFVGVRGIVHGALTMVANQGQGAYVVLDEPVLAGDTGSIVSEGGIDLTLPIDSNVSLHAQTLGNVVLSPDPLPAGWQSEDGGTSIVGHDGSTMTWTLDTGASVGTGISLLVQ